MAAATAATYESGVTCGSISRPIPASGPDRLRMRSAAAASHGPASPAGTASSSPSARARKPTCSDPAPRDRSRAVSTRRWSTMSAAVSTIA